MCNGNKDFDKSEISVLVHGPVSGNTAQALDNLRKIFPESPIILSTWKNSDLDGLTYDVLVECEDPGAEYFNVPLNAKDSEKYQGCKEFTIDGHMYFNVPKKNNVNRMLCTVQDGLAKVQTKYVLKVRSDVILKSDNFLSYWDKYPSYNGKYKIFKHRIINDSTYAQFAHVMKNGIQLLPFHMSDWLHFGLTEDVKLLFSCPFHDREDSSQYWYKAGRKRTQFEPFPDAGWQYPPETYILYSLVKKYYPEVSYKDSDDYNQENMSVSNIVMADNFIFLDQDLLNFEIKKYPYIFDWDPEIYDGFITTREWHNLYKTYCDRNFKYCDIDFKRLPYFKKSLNFIFFVKYPRRYFRLFKRMLNVFSKRKLREKFYIGADK